VDDFNRQQMLCSAWLREQLEATNRFYGELYGRFSDWNEAPAIKTVMFLAVMKRHERDQEFWTELLVATSNRDRRIPQGGAGVNGADKA